MKLYHFTSKHHIDGCRRSGLILGVIPVRLDPDPKVVRGFQWLTRNGSFDQSWCDPEYSTLPYDRAECRITVKIPKSRRKSDLISWLDFCEQMEEVVEDYIIDSLNAYGDPENWYLFRGRVSPGWFRDIVWKGGSHDFSYTNTQARSLITAAAARRCGCRLKAG